MDKNRNMLARNVTTAGIIALTCIAVLAGLGVAYACHTDSGPAYARDSGCYFISAVSNDNGTPQNLGDFHPADPGDNGYDPGSPQTIGQSCSRYNLNVAATTTHLSSNGDTVHVSITNAYPGYAPTIYFKLNNDSLNMLTQSITLSQDPAILFSLTGASQGDPLEPGVTGGVQIAVSGEANPGQAYAFNIAIGLAENQQLPPAIPLNLTAATVSPHRINLTWQDASGGGAAFIIERKHGSNGTWEVIDRTWRGVTGYSDGGLEPGITYYYRLRAYNSSGHSDYSNQASATTPLPPPPQPELRSPAEDSKINILTPRLQWRPSNGAGSYTLQLARDDDFAHIVVERSGLSGLTFEVPSGMLEVKNEYFWRVKAVSSQGSSEWSHIWNFRTKN
jgi:hypothetical protein